MKMKRRYLIYLTLCLLSAGSAPALAQSAELSLDDCRRMALDYSNAATKARLDLEVARYRKQEALTEFFPQVSAFSLGFRALNPMVDMDIKDVFGSNDFTNNLQNIIDSYAPTVGVVPRVSLLSGAFTAGVSILQPLYAGGRIVNGNRLASLGVEAARLSGSIAGRELMENVDELYWELVCLQEKQTTLESALGLIEMLHRDATSALSAGLATEDVVEELDYQKNNLESSRLQLRSGILLAKINLFNTIGQKYSLIATAASEEKPYIDSIKVHLPSESPQNPETYYCDPESIAACLEESRLLELQVQAGKLQKKMALGEALPQVAVGAGYSYGRFVGDARSNLTAFATIQVPLSGWWKTSSTLGRLQAEVEKAESDRDYLRAQLELKVRKCYLDLTVCWDSYILALEAEDIARASFKRQEVSYEAGMVGASELAGARVKLRQEEDKRIEAESDYFKALHSWNELRKAANN